MSLISWLKPSKRSVPTFAPPSVEKEENKALKAELAQEVVTFERRRHTVQQIAEQALQRMKEGHPG